MKENVPFNKLSLFDLCWTSVKNTITVLNAYPSGQYNVGAFVNHDSFIIVN